MRYLLIVLTMLLCPVSAGYADVSVGFGIPGLNIGINVPAYPDLVQVPGYPVYYDPRSDSNYFFYDGLYWVFQNDQWYESSWYDGPWRLVDPYDVPVFLLRVPVRYYHHPPPYFYGWHADRPPHWGEHWGRAWERHRGGWERWNRRAVPSIAPLPRYQRAYSGERYPREPRERSTIRSQNYRYRPLEHITRQRFQQEGGRGPERNMRGRHDRGGHNQGNQNDSSRSHGNGHRERDRHDR